MVQVSNLSSRVKDIINNNYNVIIANNHFADNIYKRLLVSLYSVRQNADSKVVSVLEKYRFELSEYFTDCEISDLQNEYKQVAMYCYQKGVFRAIEKLKLPDDVFCWMTDLLVPIHFPHEVTDKDYNNRFKYLRQILEHIFRSMIDNGIVPPIFESHKPGAKQDSLNLSAISKFLANILQEDEALAEKYPVKTEQAVLPNLLQDIVKNIIFTTGSALHTAREKQDEKFMVYDQYLPKVDGSTFLLKSYVFAMCDLILWYSSYFESHPDKERNALEWDIVKKRK